jgi:hypothetical protein
MPCATIARCAATGSWRTASGKKEPHHWPTGLAPRHQSENAVRGHERNQLAMLEREYSHVARLRTQDCLLQLSPAHLPIRRSLAAVLPNRSLTHCPGLHNGVALRRPLRPFAKARGFAGRGHRQMCPPCRFHTIRADEKTPTRSWLYACILPRKAPALGNRRVPPPFTGAIDLGAWSTSHVLARTHLSVRLFSDVPTAMTAMWTWCTTGTDHSPWQATIRHACPAPLQLAHLSYSLPATFRSSLYRTLSLTASHTPTVRRNTPKGTPMRQACFRPDTAVPGAKWVWFPRGSRAPAVPPRPQFPRVFPRGSRPIPARELREPSSRAVPQFPRGSRATGVPARCRQARKPCVAARGSRAPPGHFSAPRVLFFFRRIFARRKLGEDHEGTHFIFGMWFGKTVSPIGMGGQARIPEARFLQGREN